MKIRGTAAHVYEKYLQLARDANSSGDRVQAENYLQHAEHYYRILLASQAHQASQQQFGGGQQPAVAGAEQRPGGNEPYPQNQSGGQAFGFAEDGDEGDECEKAAQ